jgi:hypothetical protein
MKPNSNDQMVMLATKIEELLGDELKHLALPVLLSEALRLDIFRKKQRDAAKEVLRAFRYTAGSSLTHSS